MNDLWGWAVVGLLAVQSFFLWRLSRKPKQAAVEHPPHEWAERPASPPEEKDNGGVTLMTPERDEKILSDEDWE